MYSKIIVPLDGSDTPNRPCAVMIARALSVPIDLVEAFDVLPRRCAIVTQSTP